VQAEFIDIDLLVKEMSKEEFEEQEHPRASDGKFTDKHGSKANSKLKEKAEKKRKRPKAWYKERAYQVAAAGAGVSVGLLALFLLRKNPSGLADDVIKQTKDDVAKEVNKHLGELKSVPKEAKPTIDLDAIKPKASEGDFAESQIDDLFDEIDKFDLKPVSGEGKKVEQKVEGLVHGHYDPDTGEQIVRKLPDVDKVHNEIMLRIGDDALDKAYGFSKRIKLDKLKTRNISSSKETRHLFEDFISKGRWNNETLTDPIVRINQMTSNKTASIGEFKRLKAFYGNFRKELNKEIKLASYFIERESKKGVDSKLIDAKRRQVQKMAESRDIAKVAELIATYRGHRLAIGANRLKKGEQFLKNETLFLEQRERYLDPIRKKAEELRRKGASKAEIEMLYNQDPYARMLKNLPAPQKLQKVDKRLKDEVAEWSDNWLKAHNLSGEPKNTKRALTWVDKVKLGASKGKPDDYAKLINRMKREIQDVESGKIPRLGGENKGLKGLITKAMSKEDFEEHEHPRDSSGKFTDSGKADTSPKKPKGSHGGFREFSGRLPKDAHLAVEIQRKKYKQKYPDLSDEQIDNKLIEYGEKKQKGADWYLYVSDRQQYEKIQQQRLKDAKDSKMGRVYYKGKEVEYWPPVKVGDSLKESANRFRRDVYKYKAMKEATQKFNDKELPTVERNAARLVLAVGTVASALGLAALVARKPSLRGLVTEVTPREFKNVAGRGKVPLWETGKINEKTVPIEPRLIQLNRVVGENVSNPYREVQSANKFNKLLATFVARRTKQSRKMEEWLDKGGEVSFSLGPGARGYTGKRFTLKDEYIEQFSKDTRGTYEWRNGDEALIKGQTVLMGEGKNGNISSGRLFELWRLQRKTGKLKNVELEKMGVKKVAEDFVLEDRAKFVDYVKNNTNWVDVGPSGQMKVSVSGDLFPPSILRRWSQHPSAKGARKKIEDFAGWEEFMEQEIAGISRTVLAGLALTPGAGSAMYFFYMDMKKASDSLKKSRKEQAELTSSFKPEKVSTQAEAVGSTSKRKAPKGEPQKKENEPEAETIDQEQPSEEGAGSSDKIREEYGDEVAQMQEDYKKDLEEERKRMSKKGYEPENNEETIPITVTDAVALETAMQIAEISQACKIAIESGMPGSDQFIQLNNKIIELYTIFKDQAKAKEIS
jgi:hypothetical protein